MSQYNKPKQFDNNLLVIGAGSGGLVSAYIAAAVKAKVTLIEKHQMGGDCLNTGCVPSKALIKSAKIAHQIRQASQYGIRVDAPKVDFGQVMGRIRQVIQEIEPHDSVERYQSLGVEVIQGEAKLVSPWHVSVNGKIISAKNIIIATGARPFIPNITGLEQIDYLTSDNLWQIEQCPKKLVVLGGGPIGCELSQAFARLGSSVTQIEMGTHLMPREDSDVSEFVLQRFSEEGVQVKTQHTAKRIEVVDGIKSIICEFKGAEVAFEFDQLLIAVGRRANVTGFGLEELGIQLSDRATVQVDPFLRTNLPNIFAVGDVAGPYQFTHTASHMAWYAAVNALFGVVKKFKVDYSVIPWATFVDPEVARVGLSEAEARAQNMAYEVTRYGIDDLDRAIADGSNEGWVKVLTVPKKDTILGVTIVGQHAADLLTEYTLAMKHGLGLNKILGTIHIYPTLAEANKFAAGNWKKAHAPEKLLSWVARFHQWRRG